MKAPDAALVRARAKAPLADLEVLHLSSADLACLRNLESCRQLSSLYANANVIHELDGLAMLRRLWRVDLSDNKIKTLAPLASFAVLGFVNLERNLLDYEDLVCLRDMHLLELRVAGNTKMLPRETTDAAARTQHRMKLTALLPYVWTLDGHYVTTPERNRALEAYDGFVLGLLQRHREKTHFGSTSQVWNSVGDTETKTDCFGVAVQEDAIKVLDTIVKQPTRQADQQDLYRLKALASFHDDECDVHNAHAHFAPGKHWATAKKMPKIRLPLALALAPRTRLELAVLLATHLDFPLPRKLLVEALAIVLLHQESGGVAFHESGHWIEELAQLPLYALVALVSPLRAMAMEEHGAFNQTQPLEHQLWMDMPVVFNTLLDGTERQLRLEQAEIPHQPFVQRCAFAVALLSRAASFREKTPGSGSGSSEVEALMEAAKLASTQALESVGCSVLLIRNNDTLWKKKTQSKDGAPREYRKPWNETRTSPVLQGAQESETIYGPVLIPNERRRRPRPGEWLEVKPKLFLKVRTISPDGAYLTAVAPTAASDTRAPAITIRVDQVVRVSSSMWRVTSMQSGELRDIVHVAANSKPRPLGKLHRDNGAFHKHGAARNQGYPNLDVRRSDLHGLVDNDDERSLMAQPQPVELFSSNDTLDANYVLASPSLVNLQNACAARIFEQQQRQPAGLWNPIHTASYQTVPVQPVDTIDNSRLEGSSDKEKKHQEKKARPAEGHPENDWRALQRDMQLLLGIQPSPESETTSNGSNVNLFITEVEPPIDDDIATPIQGSPPLLGSASTPTLLIHSCASPYMAKSLNATPKPKRLAALSWHQVATKPKLLIAAPLPPSPAYSILNTESNATKPTASSPLPGKPNPDGCGSLGRPMSSSSPMRVPLRLTRCNVSLPSLSLSTQNKV